MPPPHYFKYLVESIHVSDMYVAVCTNECKGHTLQSEVVASSFTFFCV